MAEEFFQYCADHNKSTREERIEALRQFVAMNKAKYLPHPEEFLKGKKVLRIKKKQ